MSYYDYRQDEDYLARQDEDAQESFINGQNGALELVSPQEPNNDYYMMGWHDTKQQLATGQLCRACRQTGCCFSSQQPTPDDWEEF